MRKERTKMQNVFDYSKLRGRIVEKFGSIEAFASETSISNMSVSKKLNNKVAISRDDMIEWSGLLDIPLEEYGVFYFVKKLNDV